MSTVPFTQRARGRWTALGIAVVSLAAVTGGVLVLPRVLRGRSNAPTASPTAVATIRTTPVGEAGTVGDLTITQDAMQLAEITLAPVKRQVVREKLALSGVVEAGGDRVAKITPRVAGKVTRVFPVVGDAVRAGQTLALIESGELAQTQATYVQAGGRVAAAQSSVVRQRQLAGLGQFGRPPVEEARRAAVTSQGDAKTAESEVASAQAGVAQARSEQRTLQAGLSQAQTRLQVAQSRFERSERLLKEELIARQEWEQVRADRDSAGADIEVARAKIAQGGAAVETAKAALAAAQARRDAARQRHSIETQALAREESVFRGGFVTSKELVEAEAALRQARLDQQAAAQAVRLLGGRPGGGSTVAVTSPISGRVQERKVSLGETVDTDHDLFTVVNLDRVVAELQVAPRDLRHIRPGQQVELTSETAPGSVFAGRVASLGTASDQTTRAVPVRVVLDNRGGTLRPGAFVRGNAVTDVRRDRIVVPVKAIQEHTNKKTVYVAASAKPGDFEVRHVVLGATVGNGLREVAKGLAGNEKVAVTGTFYLKSEALKSSLSDGCCAVDTKKE